MHRSLEGKSIIVTGGARGIGEAIARELAAHGASIMVADINEAGARTVAAEIGASGGRVESLKLDVTKRGSVAAVIERTVSVFGSLDGMINNAGVVQSKAFLSLDETDWSRIMDINALGVLIGIQEAAKVMIAQGRGGKIVNTASIAGKQGYRELAHYCASKAAVISLTQSAAKDLGPHKINVNAFCPGIVDTEMWNIIGQGFVDEGWTKTPQEAFDTAATTAILGRPSYVSDLVGLVRFLASSESDFVTGQAIVVDGGILFS
jgi:meso-butanediol dehydrogenase / (S,S)-butanediol dehydrogenase / diacetyl reductase